MKAHSSQIVLNPTIRFINNQKSAGINFLQLAKIYWLRDWIISYNHDYDFVFKLILLFHLWKPNARTDAYIKIKIIVLIIFSFYFIDIIYL